MLETRKEKKRLKISGDESRIKKAKDKNSLFEDKNKSGKFLKEFMVNIMRNIFKNIYLILIIFLIQIVLSNNNIKYNEYKFSNITLKINGI